MRGTHRDAERCLPLTPIAFEILLALAEGERHGYDVMLAIERRTGGRLSPNPGTLYRAIDRLVREGLLEATTRRGPAGAEPRKFFRLSRLGARAAVAEAARLADQVGAVRRLLSRFGGAS
jgi:DNA-binding PadR family transcriptional regulator